ncbi:MAG: type III-B CRISPR module RAMP protein Cmr6 [Gammaproteobacteria bacterium]|nr:type III-B CRISPR module RAMP protein Cmr6 [Gammaproteobacteria bacterium]
MVLPLYAFDNKANLARQDAGNAGLWFERFFDRYDDQGRVEDTTKQGWLKTNEGKAGDADGLTRATDQQSRMVSLLNGKKAVFKIDWHFITGTGNPHPVENGLTWHPIYGTPYLTGASVKGIVRSWVEQWQYKTEEQEEKRARLLEWFGSNTKDTGDAEFKQAAGSVVFFDAIPLEPVTLGVDVMTPHMGKWYEQGGDISNVETQPERVPADWHDPTPIPFLVVKKASFLFSVAPRCGNFREDLDMDLVMDCLANSLHWLGAGAKTATGYGQMSLDQSSTDNFNKAIKPDNQTPEQAKMYELREMFDKDRINNIKDNGGLTAHTLKTLLKGAGTWDEGDKLHLEDLAREIYGFIGWGSKKKKKENQELVAALRS